MFLPIRPKPLIPTFTAMSKTSYKLGKFVSIVGHSLSQMWDRRSPVYIYDFQPFTYLTYTGKRKSKIMRRVSACQASVLLKFLKLHFRT